jgi:uncharacterized protein with HEPN domain
MEIRQRAYLLDILHSAEIVEDYIAGYSPELFLEDVRTQDAVLRRLLVIGEAAARLSDETKAAFENVPFGKIVGMRNKIVHDYGQVDLQIIWETAQLHLPKVREVLNDWFGRDGVHEH